MGAREAGRLLSAVAAAALAVALSSPAASAAVLSGAVSILTQRDVVKAFAASGVRLDNPDAGLLESVTTLSLRNPVAAYSLGVSIYPTASQARAVFRGGEPGWRQAGYAVALVRNVIVAVSPRGAVLGRKAAKAFAMPAPISDSVARLNR